jgi:hypothetical protein
MRVNGQLHAPAAICPRERAPDSLWIGDCLSLRAGLDTETRGKILCLCRWSNPGRPVCSQTLYWLNNLSSSYLLDWNSNFWEKVTLNVYWWKIYGHINSGNGCCQSVKYTCSWLVLHNVGAWWSGGIAPLILILDTRWKWVIEWVASCLCRFTQWVGPRAVVVVVTKRKILLWRRSNPCRSACITGTVVTNRAALFSSEYPVLHQKM